MIKKIVASSLAVMLLCLCLVSCSPYGEDVPEGMQPAYAESDPFHLYIPEGWSLNDASGVSGGFSYASDLIIANARYHRPDDPEQSLEDYLDQCAVGYAESLADFERTELEDNNALVGDQTDSAKGAKMLEYTATVRDTDYTCTHYAVTHDGFIITLSFYRPTDSVEVTAEAFDQIRSYFTCVDDYETPDFEPLTDDDTPSGMQIASGENAAHRLYVPEDWICDPESGRSTAYVDESGRPNVSVTLYEPMETMTPEDYFEECDDRYDEALEGYELLDEGEYKIAGRNGYFFTYTATYDGIEFKFQQVLFSDGRVIYSLTYTALAERFDAHLDDVEDICDAFTFR